MIQANLVDRFALAGKFAEIAQSNPEALAAHRNSLFRRIGHLTAAPPYMIALFLAIAIIFSFSEALTVCLGSSLGIALLVTLTLARHSLMLLTPASMLDCVEQIHCYCKDCGAALAWMQQVSLSGRPLYGFDVEIMSMMSQSVLLTKSQAPKKHAR